MKQFIQFMIFCASAIAAAETHRLLLPIEGIGAQKLTVLKADPAISWWVELGDHLLVETGEVGLSALTKRHDVKVLPPLKGDHLLFAQLGDSPLPEGMRVLARAGRLAVVQHSGSVILPEETKHQCRHEHTHFRPFTPNTVLLRDGSNYHLATAKKANPAIQNLVDLVDADRWFADVTHLASYNRYSYGTEIHDARDWLAARFQELPGLDVSTPEFSLNGTPSYNVMAVLPGTKPGDDFFIVGAHYDAISEIASSASPGAEDNASGTAAVLEMARVFAANPLQSTVVFLCYSGEEQGLHGSAAHAAQLVSAGQSANMKTALIMDMIGYAVNGTNLKVLLETNTSGEFLFETMIDMARTYTDIGTQTSLFPFGSDHMSYLNRGMPALLTIDNDWGSYPSYHRSSDLPANLVVPMGEGIVQMNVATLATLAGLQAEASFGEYVAQWNKPITSSSFVDKNANGIMDAVDLVDRLRR